MAFDQRLTKDPTFAAALALWGVYALIMLLTAHRSHFAILANDALPLLFQAESLSLAEMRSFYNGFFPIGYPATLRALLTFGRQYVDEAGVVLNLMLAMPLIWALLKIYHAKLTIWWSVLVVVVTMFMPEMLRGALSLRPDFIVTVLAGVGLYAYKRESYAWTGALLGVACLFRTHALALVIAFVIVGIFYRDWRGCMKIALWSVPFVLLQGCINIAAGETFFASAQGYNIVKMIQGTGWRDETVVVPSMLSVIREHPLEVLDAYTHHLLSEWYLLLPLIGALFLGRSREVALIALLYLLAVALGASPRGSLPVQPFAVLSFVLLLTPWAAISRWSRVRTLPVLLSVAVVCVSSFVLLRAAKNAGARVERYVGVAERLGLRTTDESKRILTDDFAMYFPQIENAAPYVNGGWGPIGIPLYRERMPQFMHSSPEKLRDSLARRGVRFVVLRQPSSDVRLEQAVVSDTSRFTRAADISGYAVYRVR